MNHLMMPLVCSSLELIGKVIFAIWVVPAYGYFAVCLCEPVTWVVSLYFCFDLRIFVQEGIEIEA